jgi:hypothetical protein
MQTVAPPLSIGTLTTADGRQGGPPRLFPIHLSNSL